MYTSIEIDFDVYKELTMRRESADMTENDVLREVLNLGEKQPNSDQNGRAADPGTPWTCKGVTFPHSTLFRCEYKGQTYRAKVQDGALVYDGERHTSPSSAARAVTGTSVNGWHFWDCKMPESHRWKLIHEVRKEQTR